MKRSKNLTSTEYAENLILYLKLEEHIGRCYLGIVEADKSDKLLTS